MQLTWGEYDFHSCFTSKMIGMLRQRLARLSNGWQKGTKNGFLLPNVQLNGQSDRRQELHAMPSTGGTLFKTILGKVKTDG
jgi:hypothetical protein